MAVQRSAWVTIDFGEHRYLLGAMCRAREPAVPASNRENICPRQRHTACSRISSPASNRTGFRFIEPRVSAFGRAGGDEIVVYLRDDVGIHAPSSSFTRRNAMTGSRFRRGVSERLALPDTVSR
jgi:hypothetical protein